MFRNSTLAILSTALLGLGTAGCQPSTPPAATSGGPITSPPPETVTAVTDDHGHGHDEHGHPTEGPHHGVLVELGNEEYHAEVTHDDATGTVTVYLLDASAEKIVTSEATELAINLKLADKPAQFKLSAQPQDGEPAGQSSRYSLAEKQLTEYFDHESAAARIQVTIGGKPFSGAIPVVHHDGHDHAK